MKQPAMGMAIRRSESRFGKRLDEESRTVSTDTCNLAEVDPDDRIGDASRVTELRSVDAPALSGLRPPSLGYSTSAADSGRDRWRTS